MSSMGKFDEGDVVTVNANARSIYPDDHHEPSWVGTIVGVYQTTADSGKVITSYDVAPYDGAQPRNVLEYRLAHT